MSSKISMPTLKRLPRYYSIVCQFFDAGEKYITSPIIAKRLVMDDSQVRKDISAIKYPGKSKMGFEVADLKKHLENYLGLNKQKEAFVVGVGNIGVALSKYENFENYGLKILALFDNDPHKVDTVIAGKQVFHMSKLKDLIERLNVYVAILTVPKKVAQEVADYLVDSGIKAIWNFTSVNLDLPEDVKVWHEDLAASFVTFSSSIADIPQRELKK